MNPIPRLLGMVHLLPLPGSPRFAGSFHKVMEAAISDATTLAEAGFSGVVVENFGDAPFFATRVPPETIAAMTTVIGAVGSQTGLTIGVNVLRNDALAALGIAAATGAAFIRVNVLTGTMYTDQGPIVGEAAEVARKHTAICPEVEVWADVMVKHATPPPGTDPAQAARDTVLRGGADAVIISGSGTGAAPDSEEAAKIRAALPEESRVVIGSGASTSNLPRLLHFANTVIVGSSLKHEGDPSHRVDPVMAKEFTLSAKEFGLL